jgi:hypothetical protein
VVDLFAPITPKIIAYPDTGIIDVSKIEVGLPALAEILEKVDE